MDMPKKYGDDSTADKRLKEWEKDVFVTLFWPGKRLVYNIFGKRRRYGIQEAYIERYCVCLGGTR